MKQYNVIYPFIDENTGSGYNEGSTFYCDDDERATFLAEIGYLEAHKTTETPKVDSDLLAKAKSLKIKGYTKMDNEALRKAIEESELKKAGV